MATLASHTAPVALPPGSVRHILPWLLLVGMSVVGAEQGVTSFLTGHPVYEWTHGGRHLAGFPCH